MTPPPQQQQIKANPMTKQLFKEFLIAKKIVVLNQM